MKVSSLDDSPRPIRIVRTNASESIVVEAGIIYPELVASILRPRRPARLFVGSRCIDHRPRSFDSANLPATADVRLSEDQRVIAPSYPTGGRDSDFQAYGFRDGAPILDASLHLVTDYL
jgi:hypothetical protein